VRVYIAPGEFDPSWRVIAGALYGANVAIDTHG
jgi:hypothetical protein